MNEVWESIYEQNNVKEILYNIHESRRVPHAFLFYGPEGVGKFFTALQFAKLLYENCGIEDIDSAQKKISSLQEPYIKLIFPLPRGKGESSEDSSTEKLSKEQLESLREEISKKVKNPYHRIFLENANNIKINSIRDIKKFIELSYEEIPYRFVFILEAELMSDQAQNALLKSLEEPPHGIIFFIITSQKDNLLTTIQSRCWPINFEPLANHSISDILINYFGVEENLAEKAAFFSNGSVTKAFYLAQKEFTHLLEHIINFLRYSIGKKYHSAYKELLEIMEEQTEEEYRLSLNLMKNWLNDVLRVRYSNDSFYFDDYKDTFTKFNERFSNCDIDNIITNLDLLEDYYNKNLNLNVLILNIIFELTTLSARNY
jgi:DNA polymerase III subunit delta'